MAYSRTYRRRRTSYVRSRTGRRAHRRYSTRKAGRSRSDRVDTFFRSQVTYTWQSGQWNGVGRSFTLTNVNATERDAYLALYDEYKIKRISVELIPRATEVPQDGNVDVKGHINYMCVDTTDASTPSNPQEILQYKYCKWEGGTKKLRVSFVPRVSAQYYSTGGTRYGPAYGWIDSAYPTCDHFGVKFGAQIGGTSGTSYYVDMVVTYYMAFRGRR